MPYSVQRLLAAVCLMIFAPVLGAIALLIRLKDGSPVLFRQVRLGQGREPFHILKFRTMVNDADRLLMEDAKASRLTRTGHVLRRTGLDELPQLLNIVKGDMAGVGPRAMLPEVGVNLPHEFETRFKTRPGLTGLAQVRGRNDLVWSERLAADVEYVKNRSVRGDLRIIAQTFIVIFRGVGFQADRNTKQVDDIGLLAKAAD